MMCSQYQSFIARDGLYRFCSGGPTWKCLLLAHEFRIEKLVHGLCFWRLETEFRVQVLNDAVPTRFETLAKLVHTTRLRMFTSHF